MPGYLRFTPDEYDAIIRAAAPLPLTGGYTVLQRMLTDALRPTHPALAKRIARLSTSLIRVLREHLEGRNATPPCSDPPSQTETRTRWDLSVRDWQVLSRACALVWLRDEAVPPDRTYLLQLVAASSMNLAEKLSRLDDEQFARLCSSLRSGRRCFTTFDFG